MGRFGHTSSLYQIYTPFLTGLLGSHNALLIRCQEPDVEPDHETPLGPFDDSLRRYVLCGDSENHESIFRVPYNI